MQLVYNGRYNVNAGILRPEEESISLMRAGFYCVVDPLTGLETFKHDNGRTTHCRDHSIWWRVASPHCELDLVTVQGNLNAL